MAARLGLQVANQESVFTYRRPGLGSSIPDVTLTSERIAAMIRDWRVSEELTGSDHQYILFRLTNPEETRLAALPKGWIVEKIDRDRLLATLQEAAESLSLPARTKCREGVEDLVKLTIALITRACDAMPRKNANPRRRPAY